MKRLCAVIAMLISISALAACSADSSDEPSPSFSSCLIVSRSPEELKNIIEPSKLVSKSEASGFIGPAEEGELSEQPSVGKKTCLYDAKDGSGYIEISLTQALFFNNGCHTPESIYASLKASGDTGEKAQGVGDDYFFSADGLNILYKGYYIAVAGGGPLTRNILAQAGSLAIKNLDALLAERQG